MSQQQEQQGQFFPFNDSGEVYFKPTDSSTGGGDTELIDRFRQGSELKTNRQRFMGMQPKIWTGSLDHVVNVTTVGQARSFTEFENSKIFEDMPIFNPVTYIVLGPNYPLPIIFNEGPQQEEEAYMEPISIPYRKNSPEGPFYARRVAGSVEDGNNLDSVYKSTNRITQFIDIDLPIVTRPFLDEGTFYWGSTEEGIVVDGYISSQQRLLKPFDDTSLDDVVENIPNISDDLYDVLVRMNVNLNDDLRPSRTKGTPAGSDIYGPYSSAGVDSFAFSGYSRGT